MYEVVSSTGYFTEGLESVLEALDDVWTTYKGEEVLVCTRCYVPRPPFAAVEVCSCDVPLWPIEHVIGDLRTKLGYPDYA